MTSKTNRRLGWLKLSVHVNVAWVIVAIVFLLRAMGLVQ